MSILHTLLTKSKFRILRSIGLRYEYTSNDYVLSNYVSDSRQLENIQNTISPKKYCSRGMSEFEIRTDIAKGWYMLEVQGNISTLGSNFCISGIGKNSSLSAVDEANKGLTRSVDGLTRSGLVLYNKELERLSNNLHFWHVLIGSHILSKRIIYCEADITAVQVCIDGNIPLKDVPKFNLTRLSKRFSLDRIIKKIKYASQYEIIYDVERRSDADSINHVKDFKHGALLDKYGIYNQLVERHVNPITYEKWLSEKKKNVPKVSIVANQERDNEHCNTQGKLEGNDKYVLNHRILIHILESKYTTDQKRKLVKSVDNLTSDYDLNISILCASHIVEYLNKYSKKRLEDSVRYTSTDNLTKNEINELVTHTDCEVHVYIDSAVSLDQNTLSELYKTLLSDVQVSLVYSDHDSLDSFNRQLNPVFKPEWNRELLYNTNYIGGLIMLKNSVYKSSCNWVSELDNSSLYYLLLQLALELPASSVIRIPSILYHKIEGNEVLDIPVNPKMYAQKLPESADQAKGFMWRNARDAQALALSLDSQKYRIDYLDNIKNQCLLDSLNVSLRDGKLRGTFQCNLEFGRVFPSVDIIVPTRDKASLLKSCLDSILNNTNYPNYRILIVDNGSEELETIELYNSFRSNEHITIIESPGPFNYSKLNNKAVESSGADILVLLNNDTEVINSQWLQELVKQAMRPEVGCVGAKLYYSNERIQHGGVVVGMKGLAGHAHRFSLKNDDGYCGRLKISQYMSAVTAACLAVKRSLYLEVNGLDEVNLKIAYNDVDFCMRIQNLGYNNVWTPYAELFHHESVSRGSDDTGEKRKRFISEYDYMKKRWSTDTIEDPAYNPNLSKDLEDFSLAS